MKRYKKLLLALAAVASIYVVKATGLDGGLIDDVFNAAVEAVTSDDEDAGDAGDEAEMQDQEALDQLQVAPDAPKVPSDKSPEPR